MDVSLSYSFYVSEWKEAMVELLQYHGNPIISYVCLLYHQEANHILNRNMCIRDLGIIQGDHFIFY